MANEQGNEHGRQQRPQHHAGQQGSSKNGGLDPEETKAGKNAMEASKASGGPEERHGEDFKEKGERGSSGDPDNPSETTGGSESGGEDKGAKE